MVSLNQGQFLIMKTPEYTIRIRATVPTGEYVEEIFTISVWDVVAPIVETAISSTG